jgi:hypothetical protein
LRTAHAAIHPPGVNRWPNRYTAVKRTSQFAEAANWCAKTSSADLVGCRKLRVQEMKRSGEFAAVPHDKANLHRSGFHAARTATRPATGSISGTGRSQAVS